MAVVNLAITIPDAHMTRVQAALRGMFGAGLSNAQLIEIIRQRTMQDIKTTVLDWERRVAAEAVNPVDPT